MYQKCLYIFFSVPLKILTFYNTFKNEDTMLGISWLSFHKVRAKFLWGLCAHTRVCICTENQHRRCNAQKTCYAVGANMLFQTYKVYSFIVVCTYASCVFAHTYTHTYTIHTDILLLSSLHGTYTALCSMSLGELLQYEIKTWMHFPNAPQGAKGHERSCGIRARLVLTISRVP